MTIAQDKVDLSQFDLVDHIKKYVLHPNFVLRVAGSPTSHIHDMHSDMAFNKLESLIGIESWLQEKKDDVCLILETTVPKIEDKKLSRHVINTRRKLFNGNVDKEIGAEALEDFVEANDLQLLKQADNYINLRRQLRQELDQAYADDLDVARNALKKAFDNPAIRNAILFANTRVYESLVEYCDGDKKLKAKKERSLLATLISYVSRSSTKTSPLSSFTTTHMGNWQEAEKSEQFIAEFDEDKTTSVVSIKTALIKALFNPLFRDVSRVGDNFEYCLNSSLVSVDGNANLKRIEDYFDSNSSVFGHIERTSEFVVSPVIGKVIALLQTESVMSLHDLRSYLTTTLNIADKEKLNTFIQKLVNEQILIPAVVRAEQGDILADYIKFLALLPESTGAPLIEQLQTLKTALTEYETASIEQRVELKNTIEWVCSNLNDQLTRNIPPKVLNSCFYEDCYRLDANIQLHNAELTSITADLKKLLAITPLFDFNCQIQSILANMFIQKYGEDGVCQEATKFLSDAQDELQCTGVVFFDKHIPEKFRSIFKSDTSAQVLDDLHTQFMDHLIENIDKKKNFSVDDKVLNKICEDIPQIFKNRVQSHCFFGQLAETSQGSNFVLNQSYTGHSNFLSRFLHHSSQENLEEIKSYLKGLSRYGDYMELPGVFGFNGNLHPQIADKELLVHPYGFNYEETEKLKLEDLNLVYDKETHRIYFDSEQHGKLDLFYFGFLSPIYLPKLLKILSLSYSQGILSYVISELISRGIVNASEVTHIPRINLGKIVIWRESWLVPRAVLLDAHTSEFEFFEQANRWRIQHNFPKTAYVRFTPKVYTDSSGEERAKNMAALDFKKIKPLYVDFTNPLLMQAFQKALTGEFTSITIQEALPSLEDNQAFINKEGYVSEFQIEISKYGVRGE